MNKLNGGVWHNTGWSVLDADLHPMCLRKRYGTSNKLTLTQQMNSLSRMHDATIYHHPCLPSPCRPLCQIAAQSGWHIENGV